MLLVSYNQTLFLWDLSFRFVLIIRTNQFEINVHERRKTWHSCSAEDLCWWWYFIYIHAPTSKLHSRCLYHSALTFSQIRKVTIDCLQIFGRLYSAENTFLKMRFSETKTLHLPISTSSKMLCYLWRKSLIFLIAFDTNVYISFMQ